MDLSIIVPMYNTEKLIGKCLSSLMNQNISKSHYEVIVVDDGSTDGSAEIVLNFARNNNNIVYIIQENRGLSEARNVGISIAQGDFIWFVDSDDYIEKDVLKDLLFFARPFDVVAFSYTSFTADQIKKLYSLNFNAAPTKLDFFKNGFFMPVQFYLWKRKYLFDFGLSFFPKIYHEDFDFTPKAIYMARKLGWLNKSLYNYYIREGSIVNMSSIKKSFDYFTVMENLFKFKNLNVSPDFDFYFNNLIFKAANNALVNSFNCKEGKTFLIYFKNNGVALLDNIKPFNLKYRFELFLMKKGFWIFLYGKNIFKFLLQ